MVAATLSTMMYTSRPGCDAAGRPGSQVPLTWPAASSNAVAPSPRLRIFQPNTLA